jgi:hypothetical protein
MLRAANLRVEVFIDEFEDRSIRAEAMMLRLHDRRVFGQGSATFFPADPSAARIDDELIAGWALFDLTQKLIQDGSTPDLTGRHSFAGTVTTGGATLVVSRTTDGASAGNGGASAGMPWQNGGSS